METNNKLQGKYTLDLSTPGKFIVTPLDENNEPIEINVPDNYNVSQPYIVRFEKKDDKYIMMTNVNGVCSEVYVDISKISPDDPIKDVRLDTDYLYFSFVVGSTAEEVEKAEPQPVYVQISDLIDVNSLNKETDAGGISPELESQTIVHFEQNS